MSLRLKVQLASTCCLAILAGDDITDAVARATDEGYIRSSLLGPRARREGGLLAVNAATTDDAGKRRFLKGMPGSANAFF